MLFKDNKTIPFEQLPPHVKKKLETLRQSGLAPEKVAELQQAREAKNASS